MSTRKKRINYSSEFKSQMIALIVSGKPRREIIDEYNINPSTIDRWINQYYSPNDLKNPEVSLSQEQMKIASLEKENLQLKMERDILKQAALILGQK